MGLKSDWSLRIRMLLAMAGLAFLYAAFIGVAAMWATTELGQSAVPGILLLAAVLVGLHYHYAPAVALSALDAECVDESAYPELHARVSRLASQVGIENPAVAVAPQSTPNAFATAGGRDGAVVAVTDGLLDAVDGQELDAVLAHEIAHVEHRDALVMSVVTVLVTVGAGVVRHFWWFGDGGGGGDGGMPWIWAFVGVSVLAWVFGYLLSRAISRHREFAADRGAVAVTGNPAALATAIRTITTGVDEAPDDDLREHAAPNALFIVPTDSDSRLLDAMQTHPDPETRIERLRDLERQ